MRRRVRLLFAGVAARGYGAKREKKRTNIIRWQAEAEKAVSRSAKNTAIYFGPSLLDIAPLLFNPNDIESAFLSGRPKLRLRSGADVPEGVLSASDVKDADRMSAILERTYALDEMRKAGMPVVFISSSERTVLGDLQIPSDSLLRKFGGAFKMYLPKPDFLDCLSAKYPRAAYAWSDREGVLSLAAVVMRDIGKRAYVSGAVASPYVRAATQTHALLLSAQDEMVLWEDGKQGSWRRVPQRRRAAWRGAGEPK